MRPDQDVNRNKEAFEALKAPCYRTSLIVTRGSRCGPNPWQQHHHKARDTLRSAAKGERTFPQSGTDGNMMESARNLSSHSTVGRMGRVLGSHRSVRHKPQCAAMTEREVCEPAKS